MTDSEAALAAVAAKVGAFYEAHPYPPAVDDLDGYARKWDEGRRRADFHLLWPDQPYRDDFSVLAAGCGTSQAAKIALRWPRARVTGIDVSASSLAASEALKRRYQLDNLQLHALPLERAGELGQSFDHVVCTGVLHHLPDPDAGLRALAAVLEAAGALQLMVYAPYGRAGIYLIQDYCRRLGLEPTAADVLDLIVSLKALPPDHPLVPMLRKSPDLLTREGLADALLNPQDRAYSVPQLQGALAAADLAFGRWQRQAPYLPQCGAPASTPHAPRLARLPAHEQYAAMELFRGTMARHTVVAWRGDRPAAVDFGGQAWREYVPVRIPDAIAVRDNLPPGAVAVLINRTHTYTDLYLPIDADQERLLAAVDGRRTIAEIAGGSGQADAARDFFEQLWNYDQVVFDTSGG
ncbi:bifunctional 2-polyprenyl-6-hydroxyphenol methylase/3-demethylubiquinol 3-O-methyltransferase UbiG [Caulobacter sp. 17J80-11]|uniref:class I SAM-dependent methyltransferase n=1 Tax=Caulobacter sp. 17J80-11 TaxID=2763502 RepID=UPI0016539586|nr:class I SAM-dependent methyltransferase [Caulobacter sp. 17J80-11]MBC6981403.1 class I SAM-dependent methyltransferase [Caulobacter sp. 17J80-11]